MHQRIFSYAEFNAAEFRISAFNVAANPESPAVQARVGEHWNVEHIEKIRLLLGVHSRFVDTCRGANLWEDSSG